MAPAKKPKTPQEMYKELRLNSSPKLKKQLKLRHVTDAEARKELGLGTRVGNTIVGPPAINHSGLAFPGFDLAGKPRGTYQVRRDNPEIDPVKNKEINKWMSRKGSEGRWINTTPGKLKVGDLVIRVESPKSVWAITASAERVGRKNIKVIDTNGLPGFLVRSQEQGEKSAPNPDLMLLAGHAVVDVPDSDAVRPDLQPLVERFQAHLLEDVGVSSLRTVKIPPEKEKLGPDDYLAKYGDAKFWGMVDNARASWREAVPPLSDFQHYTPKVDMLIPGIIANKAVTVFAAPSEGFKTLGAFHVSRSLLTGKDLWDFFPVEKQVPYVFYNLPDMSFDMTIKYARPLGLDTLTKGFHPRTPKQGGILQPDDPLMKAAARDGAYFVFDTMTYFLEEDANPQVMTEFCGKVRSLIEVHGAAGALLLAHPTKAGTRSAVIEVSEWVSGTYQKIGTVDTIFCLKTLPVSDKDPRPRAVYVTREKSRPFLGEKLYPFQLGVLAVVNEKSTSYVEQGRFPVITKPGETSSLKDLMPEKNKGGRHETPDKEPKVDWLLQMLSKLPTMKKLTEAMNKTFHSNHDVKLVRQWLKEAKQDKQLLKGENAGGN